MVVAGMWREAGYIIPAFSSSLLMPKSKSVGQRSSLVIIIVKGDGGHLAGSS